MGVNVSYTLSDDHHQLKPNMTSKAISNFRTPTVVWPFSDPIHFRSRFFPLMLPVSCRMISDELF